jgi:hypothetical protein
MPRPHFLFLAAVACGTQGQPTDPRSQVTEHTRLNLNDDRTRLDGRQTAVAYCMDACPCVRWVIGFLFLIVTMLILEAAVVTAADAAIRNTGLQYGFVLRNSRLGQFNLLNLLLRLGCQQDVACSDQQTLIGTIATFVSQACPYYVDTPPCKIHARTCDVSYREGCVCTTETSGAGRCLVSCALSRHLHTLRNGHHRQLWRVPTQGAPHHSTVDHRMFVRADFRTLRCKSRSSCVGPSIFLLRLPTQLPMRGRGTCGKHSLVLR